MRNLAQYPPNADEAIKILERVKEQVTQHQAPGDMAGLYLGKTLEFIEANKDQFQQFLEKDK